MIIALDFDNTICVDVGFPTLGPPVPLALEYMKELERGGARLILWTLRSGLALKAAADYLHEQGITCWGYNVNPEQHEWNQSPKAYAHLYIDDKSLGIPLTFYEGEQVVDWSKAGPLALKKLRMHHLTGKQ
jgi:hypothetical protein